MEKYRIFNVKNTITNNNYLFVGSFSEIDSIVNKINNVGLSKITASEKTIVNKYFNTNRITTTTKLVKALINMNDTIDIIKKKIMVYCGNLPKHQHLWVNTIHISDYEKVIFKTQPNYGELCNNKTMLCNKTNIRGYSDILGIEYKHRNLKQIIPSDLTLPIKEHPQIYSFYDLSHYLLQHYNTIKNDTIFITDYTELKQNPPKNIKYIEQIYYPFIRKDPTTSENYTQIIKELVKTENRLHDSGIEDNKNETIYKNVVFSGRQLDIDVYALFNTIELDKVVCFCKYKSRTNNELYKLYKPEMKHKKVNSDFRDAGNYIVGYKPDLYSYPIEKHLLEKWTQTEISLKEKINKKLEIDTFPQETILLKIKYGNEYFDVHIYKNRIILRFLEIEITHKEIKKLLVFANGVLDNIVKCIPIKDEDLLTADFKETIVDKKLSFLKLNNNVSNYSSYVYKIIPEEIEKNKIYINYKKVNNFTSLDNIRRYFLKIKKDNNLSVSNFKKTWINETNKLFNLSESDSIEILSVVGETLDADELKKKPLDIDINIVISFYFDENNDSIYSIYAKNCDSFLVISQVRQFVNFIFKDSKKSRIKTLPKDTPSFEIKETKITEEDEFDMDEDFIDLDNNFNNNNDTINIKMNDKGNDNDNDNNNSTTDFEQVQMKRMSVRNYMSEMRKRDNKLFNFKSDSLKTYTKSCGAVDMRQPILLTKLEMTNFEKKNPEGYKNLKFLEWGSSSKTKHFIICPRIWCIRDKIALSDEQFIDNKGRCPYCQGEIIDSKGLEIEGNKTIIIRRGGANLFWEDKKQHSTKSEEWMEYLKGTEKDAYPGLLDPKLHPKNMCMPCCFKKDNRGLEKCAVSEIDYTTDDKIEPDKLVIGAVIEGSVLKENDTVMLKNTTKNEKNNIYIVTQKGPDIYGKLTKLDIFLRNGFIINITKGAHKNKQFETILFQNNFVFKEKKTKTTRMEDKYVLGEDKFPLEKGKMGVLFNKLNKILNGSTDFIKGSRLEDNTSAFIRKGVKQNPNTSFISAMASLMKHSTETLVKNIIENIEPLEFIGLNNGDLFKLFSVDENTIDTSKYSLLALYRWCTEYPDFFYFFINKKRTSNPPSINAQIDILKKKNRYKKLLNIFIAFENFKKYCGDMNIPKDPILFRDLFSKKNSWFFKKGLNILIFEKIVKNKELLYIECPVYKNYFNDTHSICILYKYKQYYEPVIIANNKENTYVPEFIETFNKDKLNYTNEKLINTAYRLYYLVKHQCDWKYDESVNELYNKIKYKDLDYIQEVEQKYKFKLYITDEYYKGIGVLQENNTILFTKPYGINKTMTTKKISDIEYLNYKTLTNLLGSSAISVILKNNQIIALGLDNGGFHPVKSEVYDKKKHKLGVLEFNYEFELHNIHNNNVSKFVSSYNLEETLYINTRNELKSFFSTRNRHIPRLINLIYSALGDKDINSKRTFIYNIIDFLIGNITINKSVIKTRKNRKPCNKNSQKKCRKNDQCGLSQDKRHSILLDNKKFEFSFSKCRLYLPDKFRDKFVSKLTEELLFSLVEREAILSGDFLYESGHGKHIIVEGDNYLDYIKLIFGSQNIYLSRDTTAGMWPITLGRSKQIEVDRYFVKKLKTEIPPQVRADNVHKNKLQNELFPDRYGSKFNKAGDEIKDKKIKEGKCIFPFRKDKESLLVTDCIQDKMGPICATEVDRDNVMTKYGFCLENKCSSDIFASDTDQTGVKHTTSDVKPGRCCFPFKDGFKNNYKEYNECKESSHGPICATSTFDEDKPNKMKIKSRKKGQIKTYGFCPVDKKKIYTKKGSKCVLPFTHKKQLYNRCVEKDKKGKVCPIKKNKDGKNSIGTKKGVDFDYCVDEDIDTIDENEWKFYKGLKLTPVKGASILKSDKIFATVKEAMTECKKHKLCRGVTDDFKTNKITMRLSDNPKTSGMFTGNSWVKI